MSGTTGEQDMTRRVLGTEGLERLLGIVEQTGIVGVVEEEEPVGVGFEPVTDIGDRLPWVSGARRGS